MKWLANLVTGGALDYYRTCYRQADEEVRILKDRCDETEKRLSQSESGLQTAVGRADHFKAEAESLKAEVILLREQLQDADTRAETLVQRADEMAATAVERLERVNAALLKDRQTAWVELSRERSTSSRLRWLMKTLTRKATNRQHDINDLLAKQGELQLRVDELAPFRARYLRWQRTWNGRKRDESGRFLSREAAPTQETA